MYHERRRLFKHKTQRASNHHIYLSLSVHSTARSLFKLHPIRLTMNHFLPSFSDGSGALSAESDPECVGPALLPAATPVCCTEWWNCSLMMPAKIAEGLSTTTPDDATSDAFTNLKGRIWVRPLTAAAAEGANQGPDSRMKTN